MTGWKWFWYFQETSLEESNNSLNISNNANEKDTIPRFSNYATIRQQFEQQKDSAHQNQRQNMSPTVN